VCVYINGVRMSLFMYMYICTYVCIVHELYIKATICVR